VRIAFVFLFVACIAAEPAREPGASDRRAADRLDDLVRQSPFVPSSGAVRGEASRGELELRGVVWDRGSLRFSIFDRGTGESTWTRIDEEGLPFRARSFDREKDTLTLEYQGRVIVLELAEPQLSETQGPIEPAGNAPPLPMNLGPGGTVNPPGQPGGLPAPATQPGNGANDSQQLQQMADEVRRRRGVGPPPEPPKN
jgi:hypothetical protein